MGKKESKFSQDVETTPLFDEDEEEDTAESQDEDYGAGIRSLSYSVVPKMRLPFDDPDLQRLIPGCQLRISIKDLFSQEKRYRRYTLDLEHGCFRWCVRKRFQDFVQLHLSLEVYRTFLSIRVPDIKFEKDPEHGRPSLLVTTYEIPKLPEFPAISEAFWNKKDLPWRKKALETYVRNVLKIPCFREYHETLEFLEIGPYSFIEALGVKGKEGFIRQRSNCGDTCLGIICTMACGFWMKRWLFLKENFLAIIEPSQGVLEYVLLLDKAFQAQHGKLKAGRSDYLIVQNLNKKLIMQCESELQAKDWADEIRFALDRGSQDFVTPNRFESFAPPRPLSECKWTVDGATYFESVALAIDAAKEEVFIADWWLTPEIYLRRPTTHGHYWQLDYLLRRKAREGVRVYVLLYKELELALGINSSHTEHKLSRMHPNIQVLRHPYVSKGVLLWAHHEKIVCVDQTHAFVGGLDLCYGRWDDYRHRLTDLGAEEDKLKIERHLSTYKRHSLAVRQHGERRTSSLPDVSGSIKQLELEEKETKELEELEPMVLENIVEKTRFKKLYRKFQARKHFVGLKGQLSIEGLSQGRSSYASLSSDQPGDVHRTVQEIALTHLGLERKFRLWHGKDYVNFISRDFEQLELPYSDFINRNTTPRMPWHDVGIYTQGMAARDIARHFILRWNHTKEEVCPKDKSKSYLMPKRYSTLLDNEPNLLQDTIGSLYRAECQVLRSLSYWSGGIKEPEDSIHKAYKTVIRDAKRFIYIENQFFISRPGGSDNVYNDIADALFNRILKAHRKEANFRVYIILPLLPAFEGEIGTGTGTLIQTISHWNYRSICRSTDSLIARLSRHIKDPSQYLGFYGLRTHGILDNKPVTELVYVHSKLLIADDRVAIIGSANINDRSMLGRRDSEIAVIVRDTNFLEEPKDAGKFCYSLRTALFREHLGLIQQVDQDIDLRNPSSLEFYRDVWNKIAASNTSIYEEVFRCVPTDKVETFASLKTYQCIPDLASVNPEGAKLRLREVQGYLVQFPLNFLCGESLGLQMTRKEHYLPNSVFT